MLAFSIILISLKLKIEEKYQMENWKLLKQGYGQKALLFIVKNFIIIFINIIEISGVIAYHPNFLL